MRHFDAIKKLIPLELGIMADKDMKIEGQMLDMANDTLQAALNELSPETAVMTLDRWQKEYGVILNSTDNAARRKAVIARMRELASSSEGSLRRGIYVAIADALGYEVELLESAEMFRAGINMAGDRVYEPSQLFVLTVVVLGESSADDLEELFTDIVPPYIKLEFEYV